MYEQTGNGCLLTRSLRLQTKSQNATKTYRTTLKFISGYFTNFLFVCDLNTVFSLRTQAPRQEFKQNHVIETNSCA